MTPASIFSSSSLIVPIVRRRFWSARSAAAFFWNHAQNVAMSASLGGVALVDVGADAGWAATGSASWRCDFRQPAATSHAATATSATRHLMTPRWYRNLAFGGF